MSHEDSAFPNEYRTQLGLTKREYAAIHIFEGLLAAGPVEIPPLKEVWKLADKFLEKGRDTSNPDPA